MKQVFFLRPRPHPARIYLAEAIAKAPDGYQVTISEPPRNLDQSALFHAICTELARAKVKWAGKPRTKDEWKTLLISAHAVATGEGSDVTLGLENEVVNLRESTSAMSKRRISSLIDYATSWCAQHDVRLKEYDAHRA